MADNLLAFLFFTVLIGFALWLLYQVYLLIAATDELESHRDEIILEENDINTFEYFINKQATTDKELEQEKAFLLKFLERHSESFKQLGDAYEQLETYIEFKLANIAELNQDQLHSHYQTLKELLNERFETLLNQRLSIKMMYSPYFEKDNTHNRPTSLTEMNLNISLFKLKNKKQKRPIELAFALIRKYLYHG